MKKAWFLIVILLLVLSACNAKSMELPTPTSIPTSTVASTPTPTDLPTLTPTPTFALTETSTPTPTDIPLIILAGFSAERRGMGTHGNIACVTYQGNPSDLSGLIFRATYTQGGSTLERNVKAEIIGEELCFEITDFLYRPGLDIELTLSATVSSGLSMKLSEDSKERSYNLGQYEVVPCLSWVFGENGMDRNVGGGFRNGHRQWDIAYSSEVYAQSVGTPLIAPSDGYVVNYTDTVPDRSGTITNLQTYLPQLGLIFNVGHINPDSHLMVGESFQAGDIIAVIDSNQPGSSRPHTHLGVNTTEIPPRGSPWGAADENNWINPFSTDPLLLGSSLSTGLWLPETLPQGVVSLFNQNYFESNTWIEYEPILSNK